MPRVYLLPPPSEKIHQCVTPQSSGHNLEARVLSRLDGEWDVTSAGSMFPTARLLFVLIDEFADEDETADDGNDENNSDKLRDHDGEIQGRMTRVGGE
jgi:hypothetical protein